MEKIYKLFLYLLLIGVTKNLYADYPIVSHRYLADPAAMVHNGRVYLYCSNDNENPTGDNGAYEMKSIVCVSSSDLKNWTDHGKVFEVSENTSWASYSWAPSVVKRNGQFYLYYANSGTNIGVAVADNPTGTFEDPRSSALVDRNTPGVLPADNIWVFDPMTFIDDDGQAYMYFGGNGDNNMRIIRLNDDMVSVNGSAMRFEVPDFFEAAWMHKHEETYYFSYSTTSDAGITIDYMTSDNPTTGFTYQGTMAPQPPENNNNNHQSTFEFNGNWYMAYHNRIVARQAGIDPTYKRNLALDRIHHQGDGTVQEMQNTVDGVSQVGNPDPFARVEAETMSEQEGIKTEVCSAGGMNLTNIEDGDWIMVEGVDFGSTGANNFSASVASDKTGGTIEIRLDSPDGQVIGTLDVPNTGGLQTWKTETTSINQVTGVHNLYITFSGGAQNLFNFDYWTCSSSGPAVNITAPDSNGVFLEGDNITIEATVQVQQGTINQVQFFVDGSALGVDNTAPYAYTYNNITQGRHTLSVVATDDDGDTAEDSVNITVNVPQGPYNDTLHLIPGVIQAEAFDVGGNNRAYYDDTDSSETGINFRSGTDVDIEECTDTTGGYNIGYATSGEWLEYSVDVQTTDTYNMHLRVASNNDNRTLTVQMDGDSIATDVAIPNTGGWQTWTTVTVEDIPLQAGEKIMRLTIGAQDYVNINYVSFTREQAAPSVELTSPQDNSTHTVSDGIDVTATASSPDGSIDSVRFYGGGSYLGTATNATYGGSWDNLTPGTYDIYAVAWDNQGNSAASDTITVEVIECPSPDLGGDRQLCANGTLTLQSGVTDNSDHTFSWTRNGNAVSGATSNTLEISEDGTYEVTVARSGCSDATDAVTVSMVELEAMHDTLCAPGEASLSVTGGSGAYKWFGQATGGSSVATGSSYNPSVSSSTTYYVSDTGISGFGCTRTAVEAVIDSGSSGCEFDCNGDLNGNAFIDSCGNCAGGNTGVTPNPDADGDGTYDCNDGCPQDESKTAPGECGCGVADTDSDNDGILDCNDDCDNTVDSDNDGVADCNDGCPDDADKEAPGTCGCGVADVDSDNDGILDCNDDCDNNVDSDNDGVADCNDGCPADANKTEPGQCGCGVAETTCGDCDPALDSDNDGANNCDDDCPEDANKTEPGACGCGNTEDSCEDCAGVANGNAFIDSCGVCAGGTTDRTPVTDSTQCTATAVSQKDIESATKVYPNPFSDKLTVELPEHAEGTAVLMDLKGRRILSEDVSGAATLSVEGLSEGMYLLRIQINGKVEHYKVSKR